MSEAGSVRTLVVDPDEHSRSRIRQTLAQYQIDEASTHRDAIQLLEKRWDLLVCNLELGDQTAVPLLVDARRLSPWLPIVVTSDTARPGDAFDLGRLGADAYFAKPWCTPQFLGECSRLVTLGASRRLGSFFSLTTTERQKTICYALKQTNGNKKQAAALLGVSRQVVQYWARKSD